MLHSFYGRDFSSLFDEYLVITLLADSARIFRAYFKRRYSEGIFIYVCSHTVCSFFCLLNLFSILIGGDFHRYGMQFVNLRPIKVLLSVNFLM